MKKRITFIRIPKNASTSVYSFFGGTNVIRNECFSADNSKYLNIFEPSHCTLSEAVSIIGKGALDNPVLAVVRNPYDRLVSMFFFARKYDLGRVYNIDTEDFDVFAEQFYKAGQNPDFFHAVSQKKFISYNGVHTTTICRFERLKDDLGLFVKNNDMEKDFNIEAFPKLNSTEHDNYREYYSGTSENIVKKMWGDDLDCFSYSF